MTDGPSYKSDAGATPSIGESRTVVGRPVAPVATKSPDVTQIAFPTRFHILRRLGVGGMAEVFAALATQRDGIERPVVIKRPLPDLAAHPEFLAMFLDEARIASSLQHPNIVRVFEIVQDAGNCLIVMELVDGKSVSSLLGRLEKSGQRLESRLAAHVVARAAEGLHYAHTRSDAAGRPLKIVHRDVSPQNVLVSFSGEVKVIDFGIAHALGRVTQTRTGTRKGKTGYMAPEQARAGAIDARVDVFALGILLWELSCGRRLFVRPDDFRSMNALLVDPIPLPSSVAAVPPQLEAITMRALARDPDHRYQNAEELRAALDAFTISVGGASPAELGALVKVLFATDTPLMRQEPSHGALEIGPAVVTEPTSPGRRKGGVDRRQWFLLGAGAVAAAALGGGLGWIGNRYGGSLGRKVAAAAPRRYGNPPAAPAAKIPFEDPRTPLTGGGVSPRFVWPPSVEPLVPITPMLEPPPPDPVEMALQAKRAARANAMARRARRLRAKSNPF